MLLLPTAEAIEIVNLRAALANRDLIGQAKGVLMERHKITADEAFAMLRAVSNDTNVKVVEVAERVALTGELNAYPVDAS
jgi:AmiR/NasT family two-component response regulator